MTRAVSAEASHVLFGCTVVTEQQSESRENLAKPRRSEAPDPFTESTSIDGAELRNIDDAGHLESGLTAWEPHIPGHGRQAKVGGHRCDDGGGNGAPVEPIVLNHDGGPAACGLRAFRGTEMQPVHIALADHQRSSPQSVPAMSSSLAV